MTTFSSRRLTSEDNCSKVNIHECPSTIGCVVCRTYASLGTIDICTKDGLCPCGNPLTFNNKELCKSSVMSNGKNCTWVGRGSHFTSRNGYCSKHSNSLCDAILTRIVGGATVAVGSMFIGGLIVVIGVACFLYFPRKSYERLNSSSTHPSEVNFIVYSTACFQLLFACAFAVGPTVWWWKGTCREKR